MTAQAQECIFEGLLLPSPEAPRDCLAQLHLAQEAAQVRTESLYSMGDLATLRWLGEEEGLGRGPCRGRQCAVAVSPIDFQSWLLSWSLELVRTLEF